MGPVVKPRDDSAVCGLWVVGCGLWVVGCGLYFMVRMDCYCASFLLLIGGRYTFLCNGHTFLGAVNILLEAINTFMGPAVKPRDDSAVWGLWCWGCVLWGGFTFYDAVLC